MILGPDNTWVGVTWDFGDPAEGMSWRLDRVDLWIAGDDNLRKGFRGDISTSTDGSTFDVIINSEHEAELSQNNQFNYVRYDFPEVFIADPGADPTMNQYPVEGFRYLRFNSLGYNLSGTNWQSRFVEIDVWVSEIPEPGTYALIIGLIVLAGAGLRRRAKSGRARGTL